MAAASPEQTTGRDDPASLTAPSSSPTLGHPQAPVGLVPSPQTRCHPSLLDAEVAF